MQKIHKSFFLSHVDMVRLLKGDSVLKPLLPNLDVSIYMWYGTRLTLNKILNETLEGYADVELSDKLKPFKQVIETEFQKIMINNKNKNWNDPVVRQTMVSALKYNVWQNVDEHLSRGEK